ELENIRASVRAGAHARMLGTDTPAPQESVVPFSSPDGAHLDTMQFIALQNEPEQRAESHQPNPHPLLVGRRDSLALIERAAQDVQQGQIRIVLVTGTLGIGRTRFLEESLARAGAAKERTLRMHNSPERPGPLKPLLASIRALQDGNAFRLLEGAVDRVLLPSVLPSNPTPNLTLEAIEDALFVAANEDFVVLAADDLQWADESTLMLLQRIVDRADRGAKAKLLVLVTARDEPRASTPLRTFLGSLKGRTRASTKHITLGPLAPADVATLAQRVCPVETRVENILVRDCGGIPFFLVNALLAWHETGAIVWRDNAFHPVDVQALEEGIPGVAALLDARLASFFPPDGPVWRSALRTMAAVALYGGGLPTDVLYAVLGDDDTVEDALDTLVAAGIFAVTGDAQEYGFAQEMVRQAALNLVRPKSWFRRLYRKLLDTIAALSNADEEAAFLANGYEKLGERKDARVWLGRAMDRSMRAGLFTEAMMLGDRLAAMAPDEDARIDVELTIVRALVQGRQFEEAKTRLERIHSGEVFLAQTNRKTPRAVKWRILRLEVARGTSEAVDDANIVADADTVGDAVLACEARIALAGVAPLESAMTLIGDAVEMAERCNAALEFRARILRFEFIHGHGLRSLQGGSGDLLQAERDLLRALAIARSTSSVWHEVHVEGDIAVLEAEMSRTDGAIDRLYRLLKQAESLGMTGQRRTFLNNLAAFLMREGRSAEAALIAEQAAELALEAGDPTLHGVSLSLRAYALFCAGDFQGALLSANEAEAVQRERDDGARGWTLLRRAMILEAIGMADNALDDARAAQAAATRHHGRLLFLTAVLWEKLYLARQGIGRADELQKALDEVKGMVKAGQRSLTRQVVNRAVTWLENSATPPLG
ncbi:MAG TPA: AAA family ATPase, partial [Polyangium sp.]|nr:AAA family ATPase [Polyangium sp.]